MVRIYIRHADKLYENGKSTEKVYDPQIKKDQYSLIIKTVNNLVKNYGVPRYIICSPYLRTRMTAVIMLNEIKQKYGKNMVELKCDNLLSEYLGHQTVNIPKYYDFHFETMSFNPPLFENMCQFERRVGLHDFIYEFLDCKAYPVWFITHEFFITTLNRGHRCESINRVHNLNGYYIKGVKGHTSIYKGICDEKEKDLTIYVKNKLKF